MCGWKSAMGRRAGRCVHITIHLTEMFPDFHSTCLVVMQLPVHVKLTGGITAVLLLSGTCRYKNLVYEY